MVSLFLHFWNFNDGLLFRADQARDAYYAKDAIDKGLGHLRTLGPKMNMAYIEGDKNKRGDTLHLGPFYYYTQYLSGILFQSREPWVYAFFDVALFIFSIPLFYFFLRQFFSKLISLSASSLYAFSYFNLLYSRFAWSCNQLFFWEILFLLGIYKMFEKSNKNAGMWTVATVFSFLVLSQIHFVAAAIYLIFGVISVIFFRFRLQGITKIHWILIILLVLFFYFPMLASEIKNDWDNSKRFLVALSQDDQGKMSIQKSAKETFSKSSQFFTFAVTTFNDKEIENIEFVGGILFLISTLVTILMFWRSRKKNMEIDRCKSIYFIILVWSTASLLIFFKIAGKLDNTRYYIAVSPLVFVIIAMWMSMIIKYTGKTISVIVLCLITVTLAWFNLSASLIFFQSLKIGSQPNDSMRNPRFEVYDELITYGHMKDAYDYMSQTARNEKGKICYRNSNYQYNLGFEYINEIHSADLSIDRFGEDEDSLNCSYFYIGKRKRGEKDIEEDFLVRFKIVQKKEFGGLVVWKMNIQDDVKKNIESSGKNEPAVKDEPNDDDPRAFTWAEIFSK